MVAIENLSPSKGMKLCHILSLQHPYVASISRKMMKSSSWEEPGCSITSPVPTHPPKSCLKELRWCYCLFGLSFPVKSKVIAECPARPGQINLPGDETTSPQACKRVAAMCSLQALRGTPSSWPRGAPAKKAITHDILLPFNLSLCWKKYVLSSLV